MTALTPWREELAAEFAWRFPGVAVKCNYIEISNWFADRLAARPDDEGCQKALRRLAIVQRHRMAYGGGTVHVGWVCKICDSDWDRDAAEKHKADCPAALSTTIAPKLDPPDNSLIDPSTMGEVE